jgi:hypothetical protein
MPVLNKHHWGGVPDGAINIMRGTPFGNPFPINQTDDRAAVVRKYRAYLWNRIKTEPAYAEQVKALHGKTLCCCCSPLACHGDVLLAAAAWLQENP